MILTGSGENCIFCAFYQDTQLSYHKSCDMMPRIGFVLFPLMKRSIEEAQATDFTRETVEQNAKRVKMDVIEPFIPALRQPDASSKIYKDECTQCFYTVARLHSQCEK